MNILLEKMSRCENNPASNTGLDSQTTFPKNAPITFVHWISGVCVGDFEEITEFIAGTIKKVPVYHKDTTISNGTKWSGYAQFSDGVKTYYRECENTTRVLVSISGSVCEQMGTRDCWRLIRGLFECYKCKFTRLDLKLRVDKELCPIDRIWEESKRKNMTGVRTPPEKYTSGDWVEDEYIDRDTVYLGSKHSDFRLRVYDPFTNHRVENKTDIEAQLRDKKAHLAAEMLCTVEDGWKSRESIEKDIGIMIGRVTLGQVTFIERTNDKNTKRAQVLDFWQALLDLVGQGVKLVVGVRKASFERFRSFLNKQVLNGLAALQKSMGIMEFGDMLRTELAKRRDNLSREWEALVEEEQRYSV